MTCPDVVLVGAGLAAQRCAETLRARGFDAPIRMIGAEPHPPYDRPPLSKELLGERLRPAGAPTEPLTDGPPLLRPPSWHADNGVDLLLGDPAVRLEEGRVWLESGGSVPFGKLLVATGARPRTLPHLSDALTLRTYEDAVRLRERLVEGARLAIVGAGLVGLEVAATARARGVAVTVFETAPAPLARVLGPRVGEWFARLHRSRGVDLKLGTPFDGGQFDAVLVAVGAVPDVEWAGPLPRPHVFVAGDATGSQHWEAAVRQGADAARAMLGLPALPDAPESVWSDQHGMRIHVLGRPTGEPAIEEQSFDRLVAWFDDGAVLANAPELLPVARARLRQPREEIAA
ncbi:MAG TPA: FAD-dependent oxidoreductase [Solirubrobacteraceae bacterium]|jgi:3-phenylpropionate/trans-cinnamate dioxygenase ferredoxin reductase subunit